MDLFVTIHRSEPGSPPSSRSQPAAEARPSSDVGSRPRKCQSRPQTSVHRSATRSSSCGTPPTIAVNFVMRLFCQPGLQGGSPPRISRLVVADVDRGRRALEDDQLLGGLTQVGDALDGGGAGADDADALVPQARQVAVAVAARVGVIPAAGVEGLPLEVLDARDPGQLRAMEPAATRQTNLARISSSAVGANHPAGGVLFPLQAGDLRLETGVRVEVEVPADPLTMGQDLRPACVLLARDIASLLQERHVDVGLDVAANPRIPVPVPDASEVGTLLEHADVLDPGLAQPSGRDEPREPAADHGDLDGVGLRWPGEALVGERILRVRNRSGPPS